MNKSEEWLPIVDRQPDLIGLYEVSNTGYVRNAKTRNILKPYTTPGGYLQVNLCKDGKRYPRLISRLVALAFVENDNPSEKTQVNHITEDKTHNEAWLLEWATPAYNANFGTRNKRLGELKAKPVEQIDLVTNKVIATFPSVRAARDMTKIKTIWETIRGKQKQSGGYGWRLIAI